MFKQKCPLTSVFVLGNMILNGFSTSGIKSDKIVRNSQRGRLRSMLFLSDWLSLFPRMAWQFPVNQREEHSMYGAHLSTEDLREVRCALNL